MALGKIVHIGIDLVLVSATLAGIRRATGLGLNTAHVADSPTVRDYMDKYLALGEKTLDLAVWQMGAYPKYFSRDNR